MSIDAPVKKMRARAWLLALGMWIGVGGCQAQIALAGITEARGSGAMGGSSFKSGYVMGIDEINAGGGVLGQKLQLTQFDIDTHPEAAKKAAAQAVVSKPFAILGPLFSGLTLAAMPLTANTGIPHFTGGEAASLTRKYHPSLLRTSLSQTSSAPRLASLVGYGFEPKNLAILSIDNEFGRDGRAELLAVMKRRKVKVGLDRTVKPGQSDFSAEVAEIVAAKPDALLFYTTEAEAIGLLKELRKQGFSKPVFADGLVASASVIEGAEGAAEGVLAHMIGTADATPVVQSFASRYMQRYGKPPDHNAMKGYFAVHMIKAGIEQSGKVDQSLFLSAVKDTRFDVRKHPGLLSSTGYDFFGELNRESYFVVIRDEHPRVLATIRSIEGGRIELPGQGMVAMNSSEFRKAIAAAVSGAVPAHIASKGKQP